MRNYCTFIAVALIFTFKVNAQTRLSTEVFGANGAGVTLNAERLFNLGDKRLKLGVLIGAGASLYGQSEISFIYKTGLNLYYKNWGLGTDVGLFNHPNAQTTENYSETILLVYPNANYTFNLRYQLFFKLSAGVAQSYARIMNPQLNPDNLSTANYWQNPTPFFGLSFGYTFK